MWPDLLKPGRSPLATDSAPIPAQAQSGSTRPPSLTRQKRPSLSPYINLAAAADNPDAVAYQYHARVLPDTNFRASAARQAVAIRGLDQKIQEQRKLLQQSPTSNLSGTGHRTQFMNYGGYFKK